MEQIRVLAENGLILPDPKGLIGREYKLKNIK